MSNTIEKVYVGQSQLRLNFSTGADISGNTSTVILVRKPDGSTTVTWTATVNDASTGSIYYDIPTTTTLDTKGKWRLQPKIIYSTDSVSYGTTTELIVFALYD